MPYTRTRLGRWFYEERGAPAREGAPAIVLLHALLFDGRMWEAQLPVLAGLGRVVVIDGPGHGKSEVPPPFTLEDHAEALMDALRELRIDRAVLVGLSWGGMLSMRVALAHPKEVAAMALLDTSAEVESLADRVKYRAFISVARRLGVPLRLVQRELAPIVYGPSTLRARPELIEEFSRMVNGFPRDGVARAALAVVIHRKSILDKLGAVRVPTLVVCGKDDRATVPERTRAIASHIAGARLAWIEDAGHMSAIEQPEAVNALLVPFVREYV
jgi:3-oxoadipate enol-lactonase